MKMSFRGWFVVGFFAALVAVLAIYGAPLLHAAPAPTDTDGQLDEESLGLLLQAMGLDAKKEQQRYDFNFKALYRGEEWNLNMSSVLSVNGESVWLMAWLDELPRSAADVPRTALLKLLSENDRMGSGKFFSYIVSNRRFVLQRVLPNENLTSAEYRKSLQDLAATVVETYPRWSVAGWKLPGDNTRLVDNTSPVQEDSADTRSEFGQRRSSPTRTSGSEQQ